MARLILASSSPRRKDLMERLKIPFEIIVSDYEEDFGLSSDPEELTRLLAEGKAQAVAKDYPSDIVIGADTVVAVGDVILGKAKDDNDAARMLKLLSGTKHRAVTSYCILQKSTSKKIARTLVSTLHMKHLCNSEIASFVEFKESVGFAGAYAIQNYGAFLIDSVEGDVSTAIGLPLADVVEDLKQFNIHVL